MATGDPYYYLQHYNFTFCAKCGKVLGTLGAPNEPINWVNGQYICSSCYANASVAPVYTWSSNYTYTWPPTTGAWICPKCGRVWSNQIWSCVNCNNAVTEAEKTKKESPKTTRRWCELLGYDYDEIMGSMVKEAESAQPDPIPKNDHIRRGCASCKHGDLPGREHPCCECLRNVNVPDRSMARDYWVIQ